MPQTTNQINKYALLRNEVFPAMSINKEVTDITNSSPSGHSERRIAARSCCGHSLPWGFRNSGCEYRILAPDSWDAYERTDFSEPRLLRLPIHRKMLTSLTWNIWFPLINSNLLTFRLPALLLQNFYITWLLPLHPQRSSLRVIWEAAS